MTVANFITSCSASMPHIAVALGDVNVSLGDNSLFLIALAVWLIVRTKR